MKTFKSIPDVEQLRNHPLHATIKKLVSMMIADYPEYVPEDGGYLVLIEPGDIDRELNELDMPWTLANVPWEGASRSHEPAEDFTAMVERMTSSSNAAKKKVISKRPTKKAVTKKTGGTVSRKAAVKKKATARKKTARTV